MCCQIIKTFLFEYTLHGLNAVDTDVVCRCGCARVLRPDLTVNVFRVVVLVAILSAVVILKLPVVADVKMVAVVEIGNKHCPHVLRTLNGGIAIN